MAKSMSVPSNKKAVLDKGDKIYQPGISVDCVILGFHENELKLLLLKVGQSNQWALPGGFIKKNETIENAAYRVLQERTGVQDIFLQQFNVFGAPDRSDARIHQNRYLEYGIKIPKDNWLLQRFITIGFYALIDFSEVNLSAIVSDETAEWIDMNKASNLMMDHAAIVQKALETLRLDRRNFQRKLLSFGILNRLTETKKGGAHKAAYLYTFNEKKYQKALKDGLYGSW